MNIRASKSLLLLALREWGAVLRFVLLLFRPKRRNKVVTKSRWDVEYAAGSWSFLENIEEAAHNYILASYLAKLKPNASLLDVGCGQGVLQSIINMTGYSNYVGIDMSDEAIILAKIRENHQTKFLACDGESYATVEKFDVIVFNESLYYFKDPFSILNKY